MIAGRGRRGVGAGSRLGIERDLHLERFFGEEEGEWQRLAGLFVDDQAAELVGACQRYVAELEDRFAHLELRPIGGRAGQHFLDHHPVPILRPPRLALPRIADSAQSREWPAP